VTDDLGERFAAWAAAHFGGEIVVLAPATPIGTGFDAEIVRVQLGGSALPAEWRRPLILRLPPDAARLGHARDEAAVMTWCAERGYPVPRVLAVLEPGELDERPVQIMLRVPGVTMLDALKRAPWRARWMLARLADLHLRLHALAPAGWPLDRSPTALADRRLATTRRVVAASGDAALRAALDAAETLVPSLVTEAPVVCHGDFHPLNVLVDGSAAHVIDWTDAALGDHHGDVARTAVLFEIGGIVARNAIERVVLDVVAPRMGRYYVQLYDRGRDVDPGRLRAWSALHLLHGWAQMSTSPERVPPGAPDELQRRAETLLHELAA
jgi:aminoglycoside phosphotransferase (APT) family kinase protein